VAVPHRIGLAVREILALQQRLRRIPGKRPQAVLARASFAEAMAYLRCRCTVNGEDGTVLAWWERYARDSVMPPVEPSATGGETKKPRRRRRRHSSRKAAPP